MRTGYVVLVLLAVMCVDGHGTAEDPEDSTSSVHMMDVLNGFSPFPSFASVAASRTGETKFVPGRACTRSDARYLCGAKYACVNNKCQHCHTTSDCASPELRCVSSPDGVKYCEHKPLFPNFDINDIYTTILIFIGGFFAAGGGIGGGGLFVPIFILVSGFGPHLAVPLSKGTIFGGAVANFVLNYQKNHPGATGRSMIDYDVTLILEPMTLAGTILGVIMNVLFPAYLIVVLLVVLLGYTSYVTLARAMSVHEAEEMRRDVQDADESEQAQLVEPADVQTAHLASAVVKTLILVGVWMIVFIVSLVRGGHGSPSVVGVTCGSAAYWLATVIAFPVLLGLTFLIGVFLRSQHEHRVKEDHHFLDGDVHWTPYNTLVYPLVCLVAGVAAGLLGIGGGMVKGPILLEMGMLPKVTAATSAFMVLFTSSCTTMQFILLGVLPFDYGMWYAFVTFVSTIFGQLALYHAVARTGKASIIIFVIGGVILVSTVLMGYVGVMEVMVKLRNGVPMGFHSLCGH